MLNGTKWSLIIGFSNVGLRKTIEFGKIEKYWLIENMLQSMPHAL